MFESQFKTELSKITSDNLLIDNLFSEIRTSYSKSKRYYHTLIHLENLTTELFALREEISDWQTLMFSIAYHDIVYNPIKQDNEERSAELAFKRLTLLNLPTQQKYKCKEQIIATKQHDINTDSDTNYFTDADLAILGADSSQYKEYSRAIRKEYKLYPDFIYNPGRQKALTRFLQMPKIYKTLYFEKKYEAQARLNILDEINALS